MRAQVVLLGQHDVGRRAAEEAAQWAPRRGIARHDAEPDHVLLRGPTIVLPVGDAHLRPMETLLMGVPKTRRAALDDVLGSRVLSLAKPDGARPGGLMQRHMGTKVALFTLIIASRRRSPRNARAGAAGAGTCATNMGPIITPPRRGRTEALAVVTGVITVPRSSRAVRPPAAVRLRLSSARNVPSMATDDCPGADPCSPPPDGSGAPTYEPAVAPHSPRPPSADQPGAPDETSRKATMHTATLPPSTSCSKSDVTVGSLPVR
jgi:hypothetical protein